MIVEAAIATLLAAMARQAASEPLSLEEMAARVWVLWDRHCEQGSVLCPDNVKPENLTQQTSLDPMWKSMSVKVPLPPGWIWAEDHYGHQWPERLWAASYFEAHHNDFNVLDSALEKRLQIYREDPIEVGFRGTDGSRVSVPHPGWTPAMLVEIKVEMLEEVLKRVPERHQDSVRRARFWLDPIQAAVGSPRLVSVAAGVRKSMFDAVNSGAISRDTTGFDGWILNEIADIGKVDTTADPSRLFPELLNTWSLLHQNEDPWEEGWIEPEIHQWVSSGAWQWFVDRVRWKLLEAEASL